MKSRLRNNESATANNRGSKLRLTSRTWLKHDGKTCLGGFAGHWKAPHTDRAREAIIHAGQAFTGSAYAGDVAGWGDLNIHVEAHGLVGVGAAQRSLIAALQILAP